MKTFGNTGNNEEFYDFLYFTEKIKSENRRQDVRKIRRICDLTWEEIKVGMRVKSLDMKHLGTVSDKNQYDDGLSLIGITWDAPISFTSVVGFEDNCQREIVEEEEKSEK